MEKVTTYTLFPDEGVLVELKNAADTLVSLSIAVSDLAYKIQQTTNHIALFINSETLNELDEEEKDELIMKLAGLS